MKTLKTKIIASLVFGLLLAPLGAIAQSQPSNSDDSDFLTASKLFNHGQLFSSYGGEKVVLRSSQSGLCLSFFFRGAPCSGQPEADWVVLQSPAGFVQFQNPNTKLCLGMAHRADLTVGGVSCSSLFTRWQVIGEDGKTFDQSRVFLTYYRGLCISDNESTLSSFGKRCSANMNQVYRILRAE